MISCFDPVASPVPPLGGASPWGQVLRWHVTEVWLWSCHGSLLCLLSLQALPKKLFMRHCQAALCGALFKGISCVQALLKELWEAAFPDEQFAVPSRRWKDMGWQGTDPATDFRGGGLMALQNLLYMAHRKPQLFDALLHKKQVSSGSLG